MEVWREVVWLERGEVGVVYVYHIFDDDRREVVCYESGAVELIRKLQAALRQTHQEQQQRGWK
jgi:lipid-A-disaccharide synthase-like uncharacterized protein